MKKSKNAYPKLEKIANKVHDNFRKQGIAIPFYNDDGTLGVYGYNVIQESTGFYSVKNIKDHVVVAGINLSQTALMLANGLSLGKWLDTNLVKIDQQYGYQLFEKQLLKRSHDLSIKRKDYDRAEWLQDKYQIANHKANSFKTLIDLEFKKLNSRINKLNPSGTQYEH